MHIVQFTIQKPHLRVSGPFRIGERQLRVRALAAARPCVAADFELAAARLKCVPSALSVCVVMCKLH